MENKEFSELLKIVAKLRDPKDGCPWDLEQDHNSLLRYLIEESYEYVDAVESGDDKKMEDELGDVLFQVLLHSKIGSERSAFDIDSVSKNLKEKIIERHPHVFQTGSSKLTAQEVEKNWESRKKKKGNQALTNDLLKFPSLFSAFKIGKKTEKINFDWEDHSQVLYKVEEEWQELKEELTPHRPMNHEKIAEEMGDLLFSMAQLARHLGLNPEETLRSANKKFLNRFQKMEHLIKNSGYDLTHMTQSEMDVYWDKVKQYEREK